MACFRNSNRTVRYCPDNCPKVSGHQRGHTVRTQAKIELSLLFSMGGHCPACPYGRTSCGHSPEPINKPTYFQHFTRWTHCPDSLSNTYPDQAADTLSPFRGSVRLSGCPSRNSMEVSMFTLVVGPPCGGKTTYVRQHMQTGDLVIDLDAIGRALSFTDAEHGYPAALVPFACHARDAVLDRLATRFDRPRHTYIVDCAASIHRRNAIASRFAARVVLLDPGRDVCLARAADRSDPEVTRTLIERWYWESNGTS